MATRATYTSETACRAFSALMMALSKSPAMAKAAARNNTVWARLASGEGVRGDSAMARSM